MSDSRIVRVNLETLAVWPEEGYRSQRNRIGTVLQHVTNDGARTPTGGKFVSRRITVKLDGDETRWVGQFKSGETERVKIRPLAKKEER